MFFSRFESRDFGRMEEEFGQRCEVLSDAEFLHEAGSVRNVPKERRGALRNLTRLQPQGAVPPPPKKAYLCAQLKCGLLLGGGRRRASQFMLQSDPCFAKQRAQSSPPYFWAAKINGVCVQHLVCLLAVRSKAERLIWNHPVVIIVVVVS